MTTPASVTRRTGATRTTSVRGAGATSRVIESAVDPIAAAYDDEHKNKEESVDVEFKVEVDNTEGAEEEQVVTGEELAVTVENGEDDEDTEDYEEGTKKKKSKPRTCNFSLERVPDDVYSRVQGRRIEDWFQGASLLDRFPPTMVKISCGSTISVDASFGKSLMTIFNGNDKQMLTADVLPEDVRVTKDEKAQLWNLRNEFFGPTGRKDLKDPLYNCPTIYFSDGDVYHYTDNLQAKSLDSNPVIQRLLEFAGNGMNMASVHFLKKNEQTKRHIDFFSRHGSESVVINLGYMRTLKVDYRGTRAHGENIKFPLPNNYYVALKPLSDSDGSNFSIQRPADRNFIVARNREDSVEDDDETEDSYFDSIMVICRSMNRLKARPQQRNTKKCDNKTKDKDGKTKTGAGTKLAPGAASSRGTIVRNGGRPAGANT